MKKLISLIVVFVLCVSVMAVTAFAAGGSLSIGSVSAKAGDTVEVNVSIASNSGMNYIKVRPSYDTSALTLNSVKNSGGLTFTIGNAANWYDTYNSTYTGQILTLSFTVKDTAAPGSYAVSVNVEECWDEDDNAVAFSGATGYVTVTCSHNYVAGTVTAPTCTEKGYTTYTCSKCGDSYKDDYVDANGHSYDNGVVTKEPTCTEEGVKTFTCGVCGDSYTEAVPAKGHAAYTGVVTKEPTCTEEGVKTFTCGACGDSYTEAIPAKGHAYDAGVVTKEPTCTEEGVKTFTCGACGDSYTEVVPAKGHAYDAGVVTKEPTCTEEGVKTFTCGACGDSYTEVVPAKGHTEEVVRENEIKGDCKTKHSYEEVVYCSVCKEELSRTKITGELGGHNYVNGKCTICGKVQDPNLDKQPDTGDIFVEIAMYASFAALAVGAVVYAKRKVRG